ncbi:MAG: hypothetical protein P8179_13235 [Candidatus Thiodiazotropha sp.]
MNKKGIIALILVALIATFTALAHLSCIFLGPSCYKAQLAPSEIIQSAIDGTFLAPVSTVVISALFLLCAVFAVSGAGFIKKLPLLKPVLITISGLCLVRGIVTIPFSFLFPEMVSTFSIVAGFIWFLSGILYLYGFIHVRSSGS